MTYYNYRLATLPMPDRSIAIEQYFFDKLIVVGIASIEHLGVKRAEKFIAI